MKRVFLAILLGFALSGCTTAPSINVLGAYFPDWMFCVLGAILASWTVHTCVVSRGAEGSMSSRVCVVLTMAFTLAGWMLFFMN